MENFCKAEAIVLATTDFGDAHRVATFFTKEFGKIEVNAYNCRRAKSPISGAMQMFNHVSIEFIKTSPVYRIHEADVMDFYNISDNLNKLAYASIFFEIVNKITAIGQPDIKVFNLLLNSLKAFDNRNPRVAALIASIQFVEYSGFAVESPDSMKNFFDKCLSFDWEETTKLIFKSGELSRAENIFYNFVQSVIEAPLNSLKFLQMINN